LGNFGGDPQDAHSGRGVAAKERTSVTNHWRLLIAVLVGVLIGGALFGGLYAQGTPLAYVMIEVSDVTDPETFGKVLAGTPVGLVPFGGRYVVRTDAVVPLEGNAPKRFVVIAFDTPERARRWSVSAPVKEINALRSRSASWRSFLVEGVAH
jgi:uncharacterized protein (DUF1330 family)